MRFRKLTIIAGGILIWKPRGAFLFSTVFVISFTEKFRTKQSAENIYTSVQLAMIVCTTR